MRSPPFLYRAASSMEFFERIAQEISQGILLASFSTDEQSLFHEEIDRVKAWTTESVTAFTMVSEVGYSAEPILLFDGDFQVSVKKPRGYGFLTTKNYELECYHSRSSLLLSIFDEIKSKSIVTEVAIRCKDLLVRERKAQLLQEIKTKKDNKI
jgi:hypothetical protein